MLIKTKLRLRMNITDAHYGGNLVDGARILGLFGDLATEILIRNDEDEGLFVSYDNVEFLAPVFAGDYIEAIGILTSIGNTSRKMSFEAYKVIEKNQSIDKSYHAKFLKEPILVTKASGTCVVPKR